MEKYTSPAAKLKNIREKKGYSNIPEMFEKSCQTYSSNIAYSILTDGGIKEFTFSEIYNYAGKLAAYLKKQGLIKGDHIAILSENRPEWGISYFAASWIGLVIIPLDSKSNPENHKYILEFSNTGAIITSGQFISQVEEIRKNSDTLKLIISIEAFDQIINDKDTVRRCEINGSDLCEILFTSGTTGTPKGVMLTHGNIMSNVEDIYGFLDINTNDTAFSILPLHHCYECTGGLLSTLYSGVRVHYARSLKPNLLLEDLKRIRPTIWMNTPLVLEKLLKRIYRELENQGSFRSIITGLLPGWILGRIIKKNLGLDHIRYIVSGGAALPDWVKEGFEELDFPIIQGYGLSECAPLISANPPATPRNESVGMIIDSVDAKIVSIDHEGNGDICVKGPNVMKGYYNNAIDTDEVITPDGWLNTGDIGYFDKEGYLYITGRKKNVIVTSGGKNIFPEEIEEKLMESNFIEEVMVFSPDDESIQALIYPNIDEFNLSYNIQSPNDSKVIQVLNNEIREINKKLEGYKRVRKIAVKSEEFPKTTTNKIKRYLFKDLNIDDKKIL